MIRHVSVFTLKNKEEIPAFMHLLEEVGQTCPLIVSSQIGTNITHLPEGVPGPKFGDVIQIIDFNTKKDADNYPQSKEHLKRVEQGPIMQEVTAIDFKF